MSERLEVIKESTLTGFDMFGEHCVTITKENYDWLIKQADRVEQLKHASDMFQEQLNEAWKTNRRYKQALEFYADENNYREQELKGIVPPRPITFKPILHDYGSIARQALEEEEK